MNSEKKKIPLDTRVHLWESLTGAMSYIPIGGEKKYLTNWDKQEEKDLHRVLC